MLAKQRRDIDAHQQHEQNGGAQQDGQLLADDAEQSALEMRGISQVQIPSVVLIVVLLSGERPRQRVQLGLPRSHP